MNRKIVVTICREYCSGGLEIGKKLAEELNIDFYNEKIITLSAKESGFTESTFKEADEKPSNSFLYSLVMGSYQTFPNKDLLTNDKLFSIQADVIRNIAKKGSCVIVGRCSDYILREEERLVRVYLRADMDFKIKRLLAEKPEIKEKDIKSTINKVDKQRKSYYDYYTGKNWNKLTNYDIVLNTSKIGIDGAVNQIVNYIQNMQ